MNTTTEKMTNISGNSKLRTSDIALIALFVAIMAVCSWIMIPATVPFTMQTFGVFLAVGLLGGKRAFSTDGKEITGDRTLRTDEALLVELR